MRSPIRKSLSAAAALCRYPTIAAAAALDRRFAARARIPELPRELERTIYSQQVILPPLTHVRVGTQDVDGLASVVALARALDAQRIFEVGTFTGLTTLTLGLNLPSATIHTLDLPPGKAGALRIDQYDGEFLPGRSEGKSTRRVYLDFPSVAERVVQHEADSARFDFGGLEQKFDLVYIDGAHSLEYVANDSEAAYRIVAPDGAILWDDYSRAWPDVVAYLDAKTRPGTYRLGTSRLVVWFGDPARIRSENAAQRRDDAASGPPTAA